MKKHAILNGTVSHERLEPIKHKFTYHFDLPVIQLNDIAGFTSRSHILRYNRGGLFAFHRKDYHGPANTSVDTAVRDTIQEQLGTRPRGPITLIGMMRHFGHSFNPVCFYLCYDNSGSYVEYIMAEITNTPWGERHAYVLGPEQNLGDQQHHIYEFDKDFHISPFSDMDQRYRWEFILGQESLQIRMKNFKNGRCLFKADYQAQFTEANEANINKLFYLFPLASLRALFFIYINALKLWFKKSPFYEHPKYKVTSDDN